MAYAEGLLFRAGLRSTDDVRAMGLEGLLAVEGSGNKTDLVIRALWETVNPKDK